MRNLTFQPLFLLVRMTALPLSSVQGSTLYKLESWRSALLLVSFKFKPFYIYKHRSPALFFLPESMKVQRISYLKYWSVALFYLEARRFILFYLEAMESCTFFYMGVRILSLFFQESLTVQPLFTWTMKVELSAFFYLQTKKFNSFLPGSMKVQFLFSWKHESSPFFLTLKHKCPALFTRKHEYSALFTWKHETSALFYLEAWKSIPF